MTDLTLILQRPHSAGLQGMQVHAEQLYALAVARTKAVLLNSSSADASGTCSVVLRETCVMA